MEEFRYIKRDISWLSFNERVLQEAKDPSVPLYERIKFLAIYSSNLDEFFRVRVSSLRSFKDLKKKTRRKLELKPKKELKAIYEVVQKQQSEFGQIFRNDIIPALKKEGINLIQLPDFSDAQKEFAKTYFKENVAQHLHLEFVHNDKDAPFLENKGLYFAIALSGREEDVAIVNIPSDKGPRFIEMPSQKGKHYISFLDEIIRCCIPDLLKDHTIDGIFSIKISRDAELYIDDEYSGDLLEKLKKSLTKRNIGLPTRCLYDKTISETLKEKLMKRFQLRKNDMVRGSRYHNFSDFFGFPNPTKNKNLSDVPLPPMAHKELSKVDSLIKAIGQKDYMLHFPYQQYDYVPKLIWEAAEDEKVKEIKITLYRVASKSAVTQALIHALEKGKKVMAFIEAKARFDEESNLFWGDQLAQKGAKVMYSYPGIKVHTKLLIIAREEENATRYYSYLGTGNFNEKTAKLYCDHALLTADKRLTEEALQVFEVLEKNIIIPKNKHLFTSPFNLRQNFEKRIDKEIANAEAGKEAYMILKMNSLEDPQMIAKLYMASQAGVKIKMIVRGMCSLVPGIKDLSENIEIVSIIDRFLEHARIYIFCNGGKEKMYTASADWMTRNLDRRIEIAIPIYDKGVKKELRDIINIQLSDNTKARIINDVQDNQYVRNDKEAVKSQLAIYQYLSNL